MMLDANLGHLPLLDDKGAIFGVISSKIIAESHQSPGTEAAQNIWELCDRDFQVVHPDASIDEAIKALQESDTGFIVIAIDGRYIGALTSDTLLGKINVSGEGSSDAAAEIKA